MLIDAESRFDPGWAARLGVNTDELIMPFVDENATAETLLDICRSGIKSGAADLIIIDSLSALSPAEEKKKTLEESSMMLSARLLSRFFRDTVISVGRKEVCFVMIGQIRSSAAMYPGKLDALMCGNAIRHYSHYILSTGRKLPADKNIVTRDNGFVLTLNILKAPGSAEGVSLEEEFIKEKGIDRTLDIVNLGISTGVIVRPTTSSYELFGEKYRGLKQLYSAVKSSQIEGDLYSKIREVLEKAPSAVVGKRIDDVTDGITEDIEDDTDDSEPTVGYSETT
jgi:recombination protein RecA